MKKYLTISIVLIAFTLIQCNSSEEDPQSEATGTETQDSFFQNLSSLCGQQFEGEGVYPDDPDHDLVDVDLLLTIEVCEEDEIRIPFYAGEDQSRTFVITKRDQGLHLRHDHRYPDGTPHDLTNYGGYASQEGSATRQFFEADELTVEMLPEAETNVWMMEMDLEAGEFTYYLERHSEPRFRAEFSLID